MVLSGSWVILYIHVYDGYIYTVIYIYKYRVQGLDLLVCAKQGKL